MNTGDIVYLLSRVGVSAVATFLAILLWSRTRDLAWMLIVIGVIAGYADIIYVFLVQIGLVEETRSAFFGLPAARMLFSNLPDLFLCAALVVMIRRKRL
jgi:hypothetical protein